MRFERLEFKAFGPFDGDVLDLRDGAPGGLHVVFGPNEAGKSTALRAVRGFLFGIPVQSQDAHLHPLARLEVGATLSHDGVTRTLRRLKRRKDTLVDAEGQVVGEELLARWLGRIDARTFSARMGLDQEELARGAEALLGGSEQGLFAAGTAGSDVRRVLEELRESAGELFRERGKNPVLNQALARYQEAQRIALDAVRPAEQWLAQKARCDELSARVAELSEQRRALKEELGYANWLGSLLAELSQLAELERELAELGDVPDLAEGVSDERVAIERELGDARVELHHGQLEWTERAARLAELGGTSPWASFDEEALELRARMGAELKARRDLPRREQELSQLEGRMRHWLRELELGEVEEDWGSLEQRLPSLGQQKSVQRLIASEGKLRAELAEAERRVGELERRWAADAAEPAVDEAAAAELLGLVAAARAFREEAARFRDLEGRRARQSAEREGLGRLPEGAWALDAGLAERDDAEHRRLTDESRELVRHHEKGLRALDELRGRLAALRQEGLPAAAVLRERRQARDAELQRWFVEGPGAEAHLRELVAAADRAADELLRDAERWARGQELEREIQLGEQEQERLERAREARRGELLALEQAWRERLGDVRWPAGEWAGLARRSAAVEALEAGGRALELEQAALLERAGALRDALVVALGDARGAHTEERSSASVWESLTAWTARAETRLAEWAREREVRQCLADERERLGLAREQAALALSEKRDAWRTWQAEFGAALGALGLPADRTSERVGELLVGYRELAAVLAEWRALRGRVDGIRRDAAQFAEDLRRVAAERGLEVGGRDHLQVAEEIRQAVERAKATEAERERLQRELDARRERNEQAQAKLGRAEGRLAEALRRARVTDASELPHVEQQAARRRRCQRAHVELRSALTDKARGQSLEALLEQARSVDHKHLFARIQEQEERLEELDAELRRTEDEQEGVELGLSRFHGDHAALAKQEQFSRAAEARELLRRYLVQQGARLLLEREMASYAERHAAPLTKRAGQLFERLTLGAYRGLSVSPFEKTIRIQASDTEKEVQDLSSGARAQLYFALRVASLEAYFDEHPAVPLVLDDLFVEFDDDRASVAFEILGELAERVQILYFTHLARDVELTSDAVRPGRVFQHSIGDGTSRVRRL
ncbi:MAG TPA: AAA family ATPase [Polyangiaceae bacterium]|nr:AAA family ATPase [Polyangiaceae bacterium]